MVALAVACILSLLSKDRDESPAEGIAIDLPCRDELMISDELGAVI